MAIVDQDIYPHATGRALETAQAHAAEHPLKLYAGWFCPFVQRAWLVLLEKRIPHQYVEINPYHKAPSFLALNPRGLVPTLAVPPSEEAVAAAAAAAKEGGGGGDGAARQGDARAFKPLYESLVLCEYLDEAFHDEDAHGPPLLPRGDGLGPAYQRARCRVWIDHVGSRVVPAFYRLLQHTPDKAYSLDEGRRALRDSIRAFVAEMDEGGPWFLGGRFSLVDISLAPWAARLDIIEHYKQGGTGIPGKDGGVKDGGGEDAEIWARWHRWRDAVMARDSMAATTSQFGHYLGVYKRYAEDTTQSEVGRATRSGRSLP
jgi:glutathione S-transferase